MSSILSKMISLAHPTINKQVYDRRLQPYVKACVLYRHSDDPGSIPRSDTKNFNYSL